MEEHSDLPRLTHYLNGTQLSDNVVESLPQVSQVPRSEAGRGLCWN